MSQDLPLSNSCGDCTVCCHSLLVKELNKPAGIYCQHCVPGKGCAIYETRFEICRTFHCGWRQLPHLGDAWRPNRSGILIMAQEEKDLPDEHRGHGGLNFIILGGEKAIQRPGVAEYIASLVNRKAAVYLSADTPKTLINKYLTKQAAANDIPAVTEMLLHLYRLHLQMRADKNLQPPMPWIELA